MVVSLGEVTVFSEVVEVLVEVVVEFVEEEEAF